MNIDNNPLSTAYSPNLERVIKTKSPHLTGMAIKKATTFL